MLSILISSTFNDMQAERDVIRTRVAPALRRLAAQYGKSVRLIDLRWGVNTANMSESDAAQKVLETCLNEIDRCDGYMICLLGNRYGWVPDYDKLDSVQKRGIDMPKPISVTELEIQYGILQRNLGEKCVVFLRDQVESLPPELFAQFNDADDDFRMADLKSKLESLPNAICEHYSLEYDNGDFKGINIFSECLIEKASVLLHNVFGQENSISENEISKRRFDNIIEEQCEVYLPNTILEKTILDFVSDSSSILVLRGNEGSGRTAIISHLAKNPPKDTIVIPYFCNSGYNKSGINDILEYFIAQVSEKIGDNNLTMDFSTLAELTEYFSEMISHYDKNILFAVDGLDMLDGDEEDRLSWIPHNFPLNIRFVFTTSIQDRQCNQLGESFYVKYCDMPPLLDKIGFIKANLATAGKSIPDDIIHKISSHPLSDNYLFCDMVIRMLMLIDRNDFAVINRNNGGIDAINAYILSKIDNLPDTMEEMAFLLLYDCGEQIIPGNTADYLSAIAYAPMGLRAQDLQALFPEKWDEADFSYFAAFLDSFLVCDDNGCYNLSAEFIRKACISISEPELYTKIVSYFSTLPDNDPIKIGSALPILLIYEKYDEAEKLLIANPKAQILYKQIWNMLGYANSNIASFFKRDIVLELFLSNGLEICFEDSRNHTLAELLKFRNPPEDINLYKRMLKSLAKIQIRLNEKKDADKTLSQLLPLENSALSKAETEILLSECSFVKDDEHIEAIMQLLNDATQILDSEDLLSGESELLHYKGHFYKHLFELNDAIGIKAYSMFTYNDFINNKTSESSIAYIDTLMTLRAINYVGDDIDADVFRVLIEVCELGDRIISKISTDSKLNKEYGELFLKLIKVICNVDSPSEPINAKLCDEAELALSRFRIRFNLLITNAHQKVLLMVKGHYNSYLLKFLAHLQIYLAYITSDLTEQTELLEKSTRILWRYFSPEPLSEFSDDLERAYISLADCYLNRKDRELYRETLEKWSTISFSSARRDVSIAREQCQRYPDDIHQDKLQRARYALKAHWEEFSNRFWLEDLYKLKANIELVLSLYRTNNRHGIKMALPTDIINIKTALVFIKKIIQLEADFDNQSLLEEYKSTLPVAFYSLLSTTLEIVLLSEHSIDDNSDDIMCTPKFYYPKTASFIESYLKRCTERNLDISEETITQLLFCLAQLKFKSASYCEDEREDELGEIIIVLNMVLERISDRIIKPSWLFDEVSTESAKRLLCSTYLMLGQGCVEQGENDMADFWYQSVIDICRELYYYATRDSIQNDTKVQFLKYTVLILLDFYSSNDENEYNAICEQLKPILDDYFA